MQSHKKVTTELSHTPVVISANLARLARSKTVFKTQDIALKPNGTVYL